MPFAVIKTGGKQYIVEPGKKIKVEKLEAEEGQEVIFDQVLLTSDVKKLLVGTPLVEGAKVTGKVLKQGRADKIVVFKYKPKKRYKKKQGHRQSFTEVEITKI
ncbi:MAG: 50S ribosomal protein L21 [Patescibacteria group bacterium]